MKTVKLWSAIILSSSMYMSPAHADESFDGAIRNGNGDIERGWNAQDAERAIACEQIVAIVKGAAEYRDGGFSPQFYYDTVNHGYFNDQLDPKDPTAQFIKQQINTTYFDDKAKHINPERLQYILHQKCTVMFTPKYSRLK